MPNTGGKRGDESGDTQLDGTNVCNMYHEPRIIPAGYIRSSRLDGADVEF